MGKQQIIKIIIFIIVGLIFFIIGTQYFIEYLIELIFIIVPSLVVSFEVGRRIHTKRKAEHIRKYFNDSGEKKEIDKKIKTLAEAINNAEHNIKRIERNSNHDFKKLEIGFSTLSEQIENLDDELNEFNQDLSVLNYSTKKSDQALDTIGDEIRQMTQYNAGDIWRRIDNIEKDVEILNCFSKNAYNEEKCRKCENKAICKNLHFILKYFKSLVIQFKNHTHNTSAPSK